MYGFDSVVHRITALVVANFDEDHLSDFPGTFTQFRPRIIYRNPSITPLHILQTKRKTGLGPGVLGCAVQ